jgi:hypothetical protein
MDVVDRYFEETKNGEAFRNSHLIHHGNSNSEYDPLWHEDKQFLFKKYRLFYILFEILPLIFSDYLAFLSSKKRKKAVIKVKGPGINYCYILMVPQISVTLIIRIKPNVWFVVGMIFFLNFFAKLRHWCEHLGTDTEGSNNTF